MANVMNSAEFRAIVEPILNEPFDGVYEQRDDEYMQVFKVRTDVPDRAYFEEPMLFGFGAAPELPEGTPISYQAGGTLFVQRYFYNVYGLAFAITEVMMEDGEHISMGRTFSEHLAQSMVETDETLCANVLNRAFNSSYTGGDGVSLNSASHPIAVGTFSNLLTTAANLSQTSLEQMLIQIRQGGVDNNNKKIHLNTDKLVVAPANEFQANVLLKSVLRTGTANNDINPAKDRFPGGVAVITRLTSNTAWWVKQGNVRRGLQMVVRRPLKRGMEGDFSTGNMRYKATKRFIPGWTDPRDMWGTPGV
jgi:hypothetical protein